MKSADLKLDLQQKRKLVPSIGTFSAFAQNIFQKIAADATLHHWK
jgi:hypothetical protein